MCTPPHEYWVCITQSLILSDWGAKPMPGVPWMVTPTPIDCSFSQN